MGELSVRVRRMGGSKREDADNGRRARRDGPDTLEDIYGYGCYRPR